jgi:transcriptional regulator with XRE-family HTH domain
MSFGSRLAEERKRLGLKQADFAGLVGTDVPKQSLYENDRRELRAEYLAKLVDAEVDVVYILSGRRSGAESLGDGASQLLSAYLALPPDLQRAAEHFLSAVREHFTRAPGATLHSARQDYRAGDTSHPA